MATKTFQSIKANIDRCIAEIDGAVHRMPVDDATIERELGRLRELSERIALFIERLRETWG